MVAIYCPRQWLLITDESDPQGHLATSGDIFDHQLGKSAIGIKWTEARVTAKHPTHLEKLPTTKN